MWSLDAGGLELPGNVSLSVGGSSSIQHMVLQVSLHHDSCHQLSPSVIQVHYISKDHIPNSGDTSGVLVEYQDQPTEYSAGIVSLHVHGEIPGFSEEKDHDQDHILWDSACRLLGSAPVQPWAYLGHTHRLGRLVSGYESA